MATKKETLPLTLEQDLDSTGTITYANEVSAIIAGVAANEIEGVAGMAGTNSSASLADILTRRVTSATKNLTKGVKVEVVDGKVKVDVNFVVEYGSPVPEVAKNIQENVKKAIETMSGLEVTSVNVLVQGVSFEKENRAAAEIEARQRLMLQKQQEESAKAAEAAKPAEPAKAAPEIIEAPAAEEDDEADFEMDLPEVDEEPAEEEAEKPAESEQ